MMCNVVCYPVHGATNLCAVRAEVRQFWLAANTVLVEGSVYRDDERVQDDSELKKQFFEALGVMPAEQNLWHFWRGL